MGMFDDELLLPGTIVEIESDYSLGYDTSLFGTTDSVTIIGTAFNGPVGKAVPVYSPEYARYIFGASYDETTRRTSTLVAEIEDAWNRGCRTIYAIRISGEEIYKDFEFVEETKMRLRVSGLFPSNDNKNVYMVYDNTEGAENVKIYKPAERATIAEKKAGLVEDPNSVLVTKLDIANTYGLTKDSRLIDFIDIVNNYKITNNNVIKLTIVDEEGNEITTSKEAQALSLGAIFPGAYFIGRDKNLCVATTDVQYTFATDANKPYANFTDKIFKVLNINTDINTNFPIYAPSRNEFNKKFPVVMSELWDFLEVAGKVDEVYGKDSTDYEQVDLTDFEIYKLLGNGFAITARAETYTDLVSGELKIKKVKETPVSDPNRVQEITDGIYSMLQNLSTDYCVLSCATADAVITGKLPKKKDFEIMTSQSITLNDVIEAETVVDSKDMTAAKQYVIELSMVDNAINGDDIQVDTYTAKTIKSVSFADPSELLKDSTDIPEGTLVLVGTDVARVTDGKLTVIDAAKNDDMNNMLVFGRQPVTVQVPDPSVPGGGTMIDVIEYHNTIFKLTAETSTNANVIFAVAAPTDVDNKKYVFVESNKSVFVYEVPDSSVTLVDLVAVGSVDEVYNDNDDKTLITIQSEYGTSNKIEIKSTEFDYSTIEELVETLNSDENLKALFTFKLTNQGIIDKDEIVADKFGLDLVTPTVFSEQLDTDRKKTYNAALYIPYKTTDNFARQLAQHCTYTSLKTSPTHGVIGVSTMKSTNVNALAKRVDELLEADYDLYAKKGNGKTMLDNNNLPYAIGRNVSIVVTQYTSTTMDGYTYVYNGCSGYAGMVSCLDLEQSSTNQAINIPSPSYEFTNYQLGKLTQKGYITVKQSYTKGYVVSDGVTMAPSSSVYRRLSVTRIINAINEIIRTETEPYIGLVNHLANRNSMQTAIKSGLEAIKGTLIEDYSFKMRNDSAAEKLGIVYIDYVIVPIYEIREVRNTVKIGDTAQ